MAKLSDVVFIRVRILVLEGAACLAVIMGDMIVCIAPFAAA